jgi:alpha-D-ribose 1-methylphosphonate 5-triphosphate synthase subunit PhnG
MLVTEAKVQIAGAIGLGIIAGDNADAARALAVIDAAYNANLPETETWTDLLNDEKARLQEARARHEGQIARTRVNFETLDDA